LFRITRCDNNRVLTAKVHAAVELYLATKEVEYRDFVLQQQDFICKNIRQTGWFIGRFDKAVGNARFSKAVRKALPELQAMYQEYSSKTPYGVPHDRGNRSSGSWEPQHLGYNYCYLHAAYPDLFAPDYIFNAVQYLLGMHPGRNQAAFVTGVGAETVKAAYGVNRADWSYIPGGVSPPPIEIPRPFALTMPAVTVEVKLNGLPTANTHSPTFSFSESPNGMVGRSFASILSKAISVVGSVPTNLAANLRLSFNVTSSSSAPSIT
jgi:hypothetical protein